MKLKRKLFSIFLAAMVACIPLFQVAFAAEGSENDGMNMYENSDFIEKEQPELSEETKKAMQPIGSFLALLSEKYKQDKAGELEL